MTEFVAILTTSWRLIGAIRGCRTDRSGWEGVTSTLSLTSDRSAYAD